MAANEVIQSTRLSVGSEAGICGDECTPVQAVRHSGVQRLNQS